jgi:hypothetical protein
MNNIKNTKFTDKNNGMLLIIAINGTNALHILSMNHVNWLCFILTAYYLFFAYLSNKIIPKQGIIDENIKRQF